MDKIRLHIIDNDDFTGLPAPVAEDVAAWLRRNGIPTAVVGPEEVPDDIPGQFSFLGVERPPVTVYVKAPIQRDELHAAAEELFHVPTKHWDERLASF